MNIWNGVRIKNKTKQNSGIQKAHWPQGNTRSLPFSLGVGSSPNIEELRQGAVELWALTSNCKGNYSEREWWEGYPSNEEFYIVLLFCWVKPQNSYISIGKGLADYLGTWSGVKGVNISHLTNVLKALSLAYPMARLKNKDSISQSLDQQICINSILCILNSVRWYEAFN